VAYGAICKQATEADAPSAGAPVPQARDAEVPSEIDAPRATRRWYGLPFLVTDIVALSLLGLSAAVDSDGLLDSSLVLSVTDALITHTAYHWTSNVWLGLGKGLLSTLGRGGLGFGWCMAGSGCKHSWRGSAWTRRLVSTWSG